MNTGFNWLKPEGLNGEWVLSIDGELCKATCMSNGNYLVVRGHRPGVWMGDACQYQKHFKKLGELSPANSFMF